MKRCISRSSKVTLQQVHAGVSEMGGGAPFGVLYYKVLTIRCGLGVNLGLGFRVSGLGFRLQTKPPSQSRASVRPKP